MSTNTPDLFPIPHAGSQQWRTYRVQRREHGDTQAMCPDIISEAEKLFGISGCGMSYAAQEGEADEAFTSCDYLELQKQQNEDWAKSIAQSVPDSIKDGDWREVLDKLGHALSLDPKCATALGRRAQIYIRTGRISHAQADIKSLERLEVNVEHLQRQVDEYIRGKRRSERHHDSSPSRRSEKRESSVSRARKRRRESRSPSRHQNRRSRDRSRSRSHSRKHANGHSHRERHSDHGSRRSNKTR